MNSTIPNFGLVVSELAQKLRDGLGNTVQAVYDYPPVSLSGISPAVSLHDDGVQQVDFRGTWYVFHTLTLFVNREAHGSEDAEDVLREMRQRVLAVIADNQNNGTYYVWWHLNAKTESSFEVIDGTPYRIEEMFLRCEVRTCDWPQNNNLVANDAQYLVYGDTVQEVIVYDN